MLCLVILNYILRRMGSPEDRFGTLEHLEHGRRFIVLEHQYGRRDAM